MTHDNRQQHTINQLTRNGQPDTMSSRDSSMRDSEHSRKTLAIEGISVDSDVIDVV